MFFLNNKKLKKSFKVTFIMIIFFAINIVTFSAKSEFLAIGNLKIVRQEPLVIKREDLNITIEKNKTIKVESVYTLENVGNYNVKSTFMFWLDTNIEKSLKEDFSNKNTVILNNICNIENLEENKNLKLYILIDEEVKEKNQELKQIVLKNKGDNQVFLAFKTNEKKEVVKLSEKYNVNLSLKFIRKVAKLVGIERIKLK